MTLGEKIRYIRENANSDGKKITQSEFAERVKIKQNTVTMYETGQRTPSSIVLNEICRQYSVDPEWLIHGREDVDPFIDTKEMAMHDLCDLYGLNKSGKTILQAFMDLTEEQQEAVIEFAKKITKGLE